MQNELKKSNSTYNQAASISNSTNEIIKATSVPEGKN